MTRALTGCLATAAIVHTAQAALFLAAVRTALAPGLSGWGDPGHVALTFDDGPHPRATPAVLDVLDRYEVHATFFILGRELARHPALGQEITGRGHEVAVHGWDHRCLLRRGPGALHDDLARTVEVTRRTTGARPRWLRAPYGVFSAASLLAARRLGLAPVLWTCWGFDWTPTATPASVTARVQRGLAGGGTILLHDSDVAGAPGCWQSALGALPGLLERCRARGLVVGPLAEHRCAATSVAGGSGGST